MPLFTSITEDGFLFEETKAKIAKEITRITTTIMKVPASFVRGAFLSYPKGSGYTAGKEAPTAYFIAAATLAVGGSLIPVPGRVLVQDEQQRTIGAVGVTGDTSDNDEATAFAGLEAANLI
jgi:uncharacterized protein GlcG (DUF336 family)